MYKHVLGLTISALALAYAPVGALAQDRTTHQPDQQQTQSHRTGQDGPGTIGQGGMMGSGPGGGMMGRGMMDHGMMGGGGPPRSPVMLRIIFALMDSDGDGTVSLAEFQAAHERIFKAMDSNKDGRLTPEEMQAFMQGRRPAPQQ
jgi:hypothetical protein